MHVFTLTGKHLETCEKRGGFSINNGQYIFDDKGRYFVENDDDAKKVAGILVRYFGCKVEPYDRPTASGGVKAPVTTEKEPPGSSAKETPTKTAK